MNDDMLNRGTEEPLSFSFFPFFLGGGVERPLRPPLVTGDLNVDLLQLYNLTNLVKENLQELTQFLESTKLYWTQFLFLKIVTVGLLKLLIQIKLSVIIRQQNYI